MGYRTGYGVDRAVFFPHENRVVLVWSMLSAHLPSSYVTLTYRQLSKLFTFPAKPWFRLSPQPCCDCSVVFCVSSPRSRLSKILSLQPRESSAGGGKTNDDIVTELAEEVEAQIPALLEDEDAGASTFVLQVCKACRDDTPIQT